MRKAAILAPVVFLVQLLFPQDVPVAVEADGMTVESRFTPPSGYARVEAEDGSFAAYLRRLPLKPHGTQVRLHDGRSKPNPGIYAAVVDLPIGRRDLHQCADAIIRLRADYLFSRQRYDEIRFRFTSGFVAEYSRWRRGERIAVSGNAARWQPGARPGDGRRVFWRYLETVFAYAGTASLAHELQAVTGAGPQIGDIFIRPGHPGHAVIVVDRAVDRDRGGAVFLLAQSYMPAQEMQVLQNPGDAALSPWYASGFGETLVTPEWTFRASERMRFPE
jgi:hypothetical protein